MRWLELSADVDSSDAEVVAEVLGRFGHGGVAIEEEATSDEDEEPRRERRSFWRGPWPWVIGGLILSASAAGLTVGLWPDDDLDTDWEGTFR